MKREAKVVAFTSGKGGVGKTQTTVNVAMSLAAAGNRVLIIDCDLGLANVHLLLNCEPQKTLYDVLVNDIDVQDVVINPYPNLDLVPAANGISEIARMTLAQRITLLNKLEALDNGYDVVLIDTAAGIGTDVLFFCSVANSVVVIVDEEPTSLTDAYGLMKILGSEHGVTHFAILVNRIESEERARQAFKRLARTSSQFLSISLSFLGCIRYDRNVSEAIVSQEPFLTLHPSSVTARDYRTISRLLMAEQDRMSEIPSRPQLFPKLPSGSSRLTSTNPVSA